MRKTTLFIILLSAVIFSKAQTPGPVPRTITVHGSAEMEVVPDEIYVDVVLREYQKRGESKKDLEKIKADFLQSCTAAGIPDSCIHIANYAGQNYNWWKIKRNSPDMMATITYQIKFRNSLIMDHLVERLDDDAVQTFTVVKTSHSQIQQFRRDLKIRAIKAAKEKGDYLVTAIDEKIGQALTIDEPAEPEIRPYYYYNPYAVRGMAGYENVSLDSVAVPQQAEVDFKKIKLRFEVNVTFALK